MSLILRLPIYLLIAYSLMACGGGGGSDSTQNQTENDGSSPDTEYQCEVENDQDCDGVSDLGDLCPNSGEHGEVHDNGCPIDDEDDDNDGVLDENDQCPNSTIAEIIDPETGCPYPENVSGDGGISDSDKGLAIPAELEGVFIGETSYDSFDSDENSNYSPEEDNQASIAILADGVMFLIYGTRCTPGDGIHECHDYYPAVVGDVATETNTDSNDRLIVNIENAVHYFELGGRVDADLSGLRDKDDIDGDGVSDTLAIDFEFAYTYQGEVTYSRSGEFTGTLIPTTSDNSSTQSIQGDYALTEGYPDDWEIRIDAGGGLIRRVGGCESTGQIMPVRDGINVFRGAYEIEDDGCSYRPSIGTYALFVVPVNAQDKNSIIIVAIGDNGRGTYKRLYRQ